MSVDRPSSKMGLVVAYREKNETLSSLTKMKERGAQKGQAKTAFEAAVLLMLVFSILSTAARF